MNYKIIFAISAIIAVVAFAIPISSDHQDLYVKMSVAKPLIGDAKITDIEVTQSPHTLIQIPQLRLASLLGSGALKVRLDTETTGTSRSLREIWRDGSDTFKLVLPSVPVSDSTLRIILYEENVEVGQRTVNLEAN